MLAQLLYAASVLGHAEPGPVVLYMHPMCSRGKRATSSTVVRGAASVPIAARQRACQPVLPVVKPTVAVRSSRLNLSTRRTMLAGYRAGVIVFLAPLAMLLAGLARAAPLHLGDPFETHSLTAPNRATPWNSAAPISSCTQRPTVGQPWTLEQVVNQALCANPQTRQAWAKARAQAALLGASKAQYLPTLTLTGNASRSHSTTGNGGFFQIPVQNQFDPTLTINYLLFDFGARRAAVSNAREALLAADWTQNATLQTVMLSAIQAYYQAFATEEAVHAAVASERSTREAYEAARYRKKVGAAALADVLQARTAWSQAVLNRQQAQGQARVARGNLANVLGLEADTPISLAPPALRVPTTAEVRNVHRLIEAAKRARPDLAAAEAEVKASAASVRQARANGMPTFNLFASSGYTYSSAVSNSRDWAVGLSLNIPLFTGFGDTYRVQAAQADLVAQKAARNKLAQQVTLDVWRAYQNLRTARDTYSSSIDLLSSATQAEKVALGRYKAGVGSILDLLNAEASLASARLQHIQAQYNWYTSRAALAQAMGRLQPNGTADSPAGRP